MSFMEGMFGCAFTSANSPEPSRHSLDWSGNPHIVSVFGVSDTYPCSAYFWVPPTAYSSNPKPKITICLTFRKFELIKSMIFIVF